MGQQHSLLIEAARESKLAEVKHLLPTYMQDGGVNGTPYVHIALIAAAEAGKKDVVKVLLGAGAHPLFLLYSLLLLLDAPHSLQHVIGDLSHQTALSAAVRNGHAECAELLRSAVARAGEIVINTHHFASAHTLGKLKPKILKSDRALDGLFLDLNMSIINNIKLIQLG